MRETGKELTPICQSERDHQDDSQNLRPSVQPTPSPWNISRPSHRQNAHRASLVVAKRRLRVWKGVTQRRPTAVLRPPRDAFDFDGLVPVMPTGVTNRSPASQNRPVAWQQAKPITKPLKIIRLDFKQMRRVTRHPDHPQRTSGPSCPRRALRYCEPCLWR